MLNKLKPKSEFTRNVLTLMTGTTIAQAIPIAISPILTRIYTPEDFGVLALFMGLVMILSSIISGRYELAILLPEKEEDAINIFVLAFLIISTISFILFLIIFIFNDFFTELLNNQEIKYWLYFIPIVTFFIGLFNLLTYYNTRLKNYKDIANASIIKALVLVSIQLFVGFFKDGVAGLINGQIFSQMFANLKLFKNIFLNQKNFFSSIDIQNIKKVAIRYKDFPKFSIWSVLLNTSVQNLVNILIPILFSYATMGFYALGQRVLGLPSTILGKSVGQVFFQQSVQEKKKTGSTRKIFLSTFKKLFFISFIVFTIIFFTITDIVNFVFGQDWIESAKIIQILIPLFFIRFISSSLSTTMIVYEKQKMELLINLILFTTTIMILLLNQKNFFNFLELYSFFMSINYLILLGYFYSLSKGKQK